MKKIILAYHIKIVFAILLVQALDITWTPHEEEALLPYGLVSVVALRPFVMGSCLVSVTALRPFVMGCLVSVAALRLNIVGCLVHGPLSPMV